MPRMTNAINTAPPPPPPAAPAIRATFLFELDGGEAVMDEVEDVSVVVAVAVADMPMVDDGTLGIRHEESLDPETL